MVATITPVGHGGRRVGWAASLALHALGAGASAAALGAALGGLGAILGAPWGRAGLAVVVVVAALYAARELARLPVPLPEWRRQVPEWWRTHFSPPAAALLYGLGLGVGFLTYLRHGTLLAVGAAAIASGDPALGALVMAPFGVARGLAVVAAGRTRSSGEVGGVVDRLEALAETRWPRVANGVALLGVGAAAAAGAATGGTWATGPPAAALVALAFAWAAAAKLLRPDRWRRALAAHRLGALEPVAAVAVPASEALVPALVLLGRPWAAAALALALVAGFSLATVRARLAHGRLVPCGCFGRTRAVDYRLALARNLALAVAAMVAAGAEPAGRLELRAPAGMEVLPAVLAGLGVAVGVWAVTRSMRWLGRGARP